MSNNTGLGDDSTLEKIMKLVGSINGVRWFLTVVCFFLYRRGMLSVQCLLPHA